MQNKEFQDHYEVLEVSPNANSETIERIFRYLATRYHPDACKTNDSDYGVARGQCLFRTLHDLRGLGADEDVCTGRGCCERPSS